MNSQNSKIDAFSLLEPSYSPLTTLSSVEITFHGIRCKKAVIVYAICSDNVKDSSLQECVKSLIDYYGSNVILVCIKLASLYSVGNVHLYMNRETDVGQIKEIHRHDQFVTNYIGYNVVNIADKKIVRRVTKEQMPATAATKLFDVVKAINHKKYTIRGDEEIQITETHT
ncbi:hypothetical protein C1646_758288 [Rhizophagus diaphanus]|nr:hypothetical protein C1646_758288 [Rhizophagus diaphanus] [Rhizophagus sp. MUCL 43196]